MDNKIKEGILSHIKPEINKQIKEINTELKRKSFLYIVLSVAGISLIAFNLSQTLFMFLFLAIVSITTYLMIEFIQSMKNVFKIAHNFDKEIKQIVSKKLKNQSAMARFSLLLSGKNNTDIEDLCISCCIRELFRQFRKYKIFILIRIVVYTVIITLFKEVLTNVFKTFF